MMASAHMELNANKPVKRYSVLLAAAIIHISITFTETNEAAPLSSMLRSCPLVVLAVCIFACLVLVVPSLAFTVTSSRDASGADDVGPWGTALNFEGSADAISSSHSVRAIAADDADEQGDSRAKRSFLPTLKIPALHRPLYPVGLPAIYGGGLPYGGGNRYRRSYYPYRPPFRYFHR